MKFCSKCKIQKPFSEFSKDKVQKSGYYTSCKDCVKIIQKKYCENNKEKLIETQKKYRESNKIKRAEWQSNYKKENREKYNKYQNNYVKERKKKDADFKFKLNLRSLIYDSFNRGKNKFNKDLKTEIILGCSVKDFRMYIKSKFKKGMNFENHGEWHLDHIIPLASARTKEEIINLNHYTNFQPLWAIDNLKKGNKINNIQLKLI